MKDDLIPADELAQYIERFGNVPVKLRITHPDTGEVTTTILERKHISINGHSAAGTIYGDFEKVCRLDVTFTDNS